MTLSWNNTAAVAFPYFDSYRIYILPSAVTFDSVAQQYSQLVIDKNLSSITLNSSLIKDATGAPFVSGATYKACIAIMGTSRALGVVGCSADVILNADAVSHPTVLSAKFTGNTSLEITTNATLSSTGADHSGSLFSYQIGSNTYTGTSVASVSSKKLVITIPALNNL